MTPEGPQGGTGWRGRAVLSAALAVDAVVVLGALALMIIGSGYGSDLVGISWGGRVVLLGVAGALIMPAPLVVFWALLAQFRTVHAVRVPGPAPPLGRPSSLAMGL